MWSIPFSLKAVYPWVPSLSTLNIWKSYLLKFRVLTLLFTWPLYLKTVNPTITWSLQLRLPPVHQFFHLYWWATDLVMFRLCLGRLSFQLRNYPQCTQGVSWTAYSLLCSFSSRCQDERSPPTRSEPVCDTSSSWIKNALSAGFSCSGGL